MTITNGVAEMALGVTGSDVAANVAADPLADRFRVEVYSNGEADVCGTLVQLWSYGDGSVTIDFMPKYGRHMHTARIDRAQAIELRDALDVLIRNTAKNKGE